MKNRSNRSNLLIFACIPAIFVLILLGTGLPQRFLPAVTVGSARYTIAEYNFYYYEAYASYVTEHLDELDELGLNLNRELKNQQYDNSMTWAEFFRLEALADMREYTILCGAAESEGFDASDEIDAACEAKAAELQAYCVANNIKLDTYLTGLYDAGMTEKILYRQIERRTLAECYRTHLMARFEPAPEAIDEYPLQTGADYATADMVVMLFRPGVDRVAGESQERQWNNARILAETAMERAESMGGTETAFRMAAAAYSELNDANASDGYYTALTKEALEPTLATWCFDTVRQTGDAAVLRGEAGWYIVFFDGWNESCQRILARQALLTQNYEQWVNAQEENFPLKTHALGMQIAR